MTYAGTVIQFVSYLLLMVVACGCGTNGNECSKFHPMVDGRNTEYQQLNIKPLVLSEDVNLYVYQNDFYVWISYDYPEGSFGTLDMQIESDRLDSVLNIHVSAQLGEWYVNSSQGMPDHPTSDLWWNMDGWTANSLWANGIDTISYDTPEFNIKNGDIRELQLSKERFGKGEWKIKLRINAIKGADGSFYSIDFPEGESFHSIMVE